jgi:heptosyltransferase II
MIRVQRYMDRWFGFLLVMLLSAFRIFDRKPLEKKRFLVVKLWAIGDSVITLSLVRAITNAFPGSTVDIVTRGRVKDIFECYPVNEIINMDSISGLLKILKRSRYYDVAFDCEPYLNISAILMFFLGKERAGFSGQARSRLYTSTTEFRKDQHMVNNYLDMLRKMNVKCFAEELERLDPYGIDTSRVDEFLEGVKEGTVLVGITPGVAETAKNRMWYEDRFAAVADKLIRNNCTILFTDSIANAATVDRIVSVMQERPLNACGLFNLKETIYLIGKCRVFISNDTGPMHLAAAQGCRTIGLFGPNTPVLWAPLGKGNVSVYKTRLAPAIDNHKGIFHEGDREGYMGCIAVEDVYRAALNALRAEPLWKGPRNDFETIDFHPN